MALSFASGTMTLASWGFGAGDIAVLAEAGRAVGPGSCSKEEAVHSLNFSSSSLIGFESNLGKERFILGYYYAVLSPLVDTSRLSFREVYGSCGGNDRQILEATRKFIHAKEDDSRRCPRSQIMELLGYFYSEAPCVGQLLREEPTHPARWRDFGFWILTLPAFQANTLRIVTCGIQRRCLNKELESCQARLCWDDQPTIPSDITSHIEPDWNCDIRKLLVAYRHRGGIVQRLSPLVTDRLVLNCWIPPVDDVDQPGKIERAIPINLENFCGGSRVCTGATTSSEPDDPGSDHNPRLVVLAGSAPNARACIVGMYDGMEGVALGLNSPANVAEGQSIQVIII